MHHDPLVRAGTPTLERSHALMKSTIVAAASGGVPLGAPMDFATPHIKQFFNFLGFTDIRQIDAAKAEPIAA